MLKSMILIALCVINAPAMAQFKCETKGQTTFQDTPCDNSAKSGKLVDWSSAASKPTAATPGIATCQAALATQGFFDPSSVQILGTAKAGFDVIFYANAPTTAKKFLLMVNAKNRYGAYVGAKPYTCYTSEDEMRVLKFD